MKKAPPFPRRLGCHCSEYFMDCTYHYGLKTCITCGHACCDNHSYWIAATPATTARWTQRPVVRCVCCIHKEREEAKKKAAKEKAASPREPLESERPRSRTPKGIGARPRPLRSSITSSGCYTGRS